jgi:hypothetical protein
MGNIAKNLLDEGVKLGVSSRGLGTIKEENGMKVVMDDFMLATAADIVADPSAPDAFVDGIMEGKEWVYAGGAIHEQTIETIKRRIDNAARSQMEERKLSAFAEYLQSF